MDATVHAWTNFFVAIAGASAALSGLMIVAMSVNIRELLASVSLPARAGAAIGGVAAALVASCLFLVPGQPMWALGLEVLLASVLLWVIWRAVAKTVRRDPQPSRPAPIRDAVPAIAPALFSVSGALLIAELDAGIGVLAAACLFAIVAGLLFAWIALVEVLR